MSYFPAYVKLDHMKVLIVGGGYIATEKIEKLLDFTKDITVIAKDLSPIMQNYIDKNGLLSHKRSYKSGDIDGYGVVIIAVDDLILQKEIFEESRASRVLCNAVDSVDYCDFIFPSYIKRDELIISVSTSGTSPAFAKHFRRYLERLIPSNVGEFLQNMKKLRKSLPKGKNRMQLLDKKAEEFIRSFKN